MHFIACFDGFTDLILGLNLHEQRLILSPSLQP